MWTPFRSRVVCSTSPTDPMSYTPVDHGCSVPSITSRNDLEGRPHSFDLPPTGWCWVFVNGCQTIAIRARFPAPTPVNGRSMASKVGFRSMARNSRRHFPANTRRLLTRGARPMTNSNHQSETSNPAASASPALEAIVTWLRGLSAADFGELSEALANHDAEKLARFDTRFQTYLYRSG